MAGSRSLRLVMANAVLALAVADSVHAQGKGNSHKSSPPSSSPLPSPATGPTATVRPVAWLDDASLLAPGSMSLTMSAVRWSGTDLSEVNFPVIDGSVGLALVHALSGPRRHDRRIARSARAFRRHVVLRQATDWRLRRARPHDRHDR